MLTPVAIAEGAAVARTLFKGTPAKMDYANVPTAVFSQPPLACVGLTEAQARARHRSVDAYVSRFKPMKFTLSGRDEQTVMKLVVDGDSDRVLGCHMMGMDAPEIIQGLGIALQCGATKAQFDTTVGIHPSAAEEFLTMRGGAARSPGTHGGLTARPAASAGLPVSANRYGPPLAGVIGLRAGGRGC